MCLSESGEMIDCVRDWLGPWGRIGWVWYGGGDYLAWFLWLFGIACGCGCGDYLNLFPG